MSKEIELWVCPSCKVLQGIDIKYNSENELIANCVNCGVQLPVEDVKFVDPVMAKKVINKVEEITPDDFHKFIHYHWVSNKTIGVVLELPRDEIQATLDFDIVEYLEDKLGPELDLTMSVYFDF